jgi:diketogulonate reductase-like aldo/keto reductase
LRRNYLEYGQGNKASVCVVDGEHSISCSSCHSILDRHHHLGTISDTYTVSVEEILVAMEQLVDRGKVRFIGVSHFFVRDLKSAQKAMSKHMIVSNQVRYNLIDRTVEFGLLKYCRHDNITVIAHSPLATEFSSVKARDPERVIDKIAQSRSKSAAQIVLNWCISKEGVVTITKANSVEHVKDNCAASEFQLPPKELQLLNRNVRYHRRDALEIRLRCMARHGLLLLDRAQ